MLHAFFSLKIIENLHVFLDVFWLYTNIAIINVLFSNIKKIEQSVY